MSTPNANDDSNGLNHKISIDFLIKIREFDQKNYGQIILYEDPSNDQNIAIKTLYQSESNDEASRTKFNNEVQKLMKLNHKCIVSINNYTLPTETDQPQISYTYLSQCSLSDLLKERARGVQNLLSNETNCAILIIGLALAIKYLNSNSVSNLDLKPNNIFINDLGYPMISDYWNESLIQTKATVSMPIETDVYKCPDVSQSNDLYSFGLILYEILVGKSVYPEIVDQETLNTIFLMGERPAIPSTIHPEVASIISKCWNGIDRNSLSFSDIFDTLKSINYKITPNVDCDRVEEIIRFIDPSISPLIRFSNGNDEDQSNNQSMTIKVRSWDGRYYPINVSFSDTLYEIRQIISQKTGISVEDIALSENYDRPLCCCWKIQRNC